METIEFKCKRCGCECSKWVGNEEYMTLMSQLDELLCRSCEEIVSDQERTAYLETLKALPLEERVARLEAYFYDKEREPTYDGGPGPFDLIG